MGKGFRKDRLASEIVKETSKIILFELRDPRKGFVTVTRAKVRVSVAETSRVNLAMQVGAMTENVTIVGEAPLVETANGTLGIVIDQKKVVDLPLNGRNFAQLGTQSCGMFTDSAHSRLDLSWCASAFVFFSI